MAVILRRVIPKKPLIRLNKVSQDYGRRKRSTDVNEMLDIWETGEANLNSKLKCVVFRQKICECTVSNRKVNAEFLPYLIHRHSLKTSVR